MTAFPTTVSALIDHDNQRFYQWQANKLGNDLFINDPDRASRIYDAAEDGCDGSTHAENIADFYEYADELYEEFIDSLNRQDFDTDEQYGDAEDRLMKRLSKLQDDLKRLEEWHIANGSYDQQVG